MYLFSYLFLNMVNSSCHEKVFSLSLGGNGGGSLYYENTTQLKMNVTFRTQNMFLRENKKELQDIRDKRQMTWPIYQIWPS